MASRGGLLRPVRLRKGRQVLLSTEASTMAGKLRRAVVWVHCPGLRSVPACAECLPSYRLRLVKFYNAWGRDR